MPAPGTRQAFDEPGCRCTLRFAGFLFPGGILTEELSWRWVVFVNIPIGIGSIVAGRAFLQESRARVALGLGSGPIASGLVDTSRRFGGAVGPAALAPAVRRSSCRLHRPRCPLPPSHPSLVLFVWRSRSSG